jgi:hypothetical protein
MYELGVSVVDGEVGARESVSGVRCDARPDVK